MKRMPYGISNYEELINEDYYYVDKTMYIEMLENLPEKRIMFLRPRKFGKTLFTSTLEYYYDIKQADKFEKLYGNTYIGKNPTKLRNTYHILRFNFSGIDTSNEEATIKGFKSKTMTSIRGFIHRYNMDFYVNEEQEPEAMLDSLFEAFRYQIENGKIYVIIDEYDHFANELLGFQTDKFKTLASKNGKVRKWYEILKKGTESVVDRIFITGVAPITLDSLTSGFNIVSDKTRNQRLNKMLGFTKDELVKLMDEQEISKEEQNIILPIMKENYNGYKFALEDEEKIYNSNMCLYFLKEYLENRAIPASLVDVNIASDYSKLSGMLKLCKGEQQKEILEKTVSGESIVSNIIEKFNPEMGFGKEEFVSMLFYLGYLTVVGEIAGYSELGIPNKIMKELYSKYFMEIIEREAKIESAIDIAEIGAQIAIEGKIDKIVELTQMYLNNLSNRDYQRFDEKYVKLIFYCITMNLNIYWVRSEPEMHRKYPDILLEPRDRAKGYQAIMVEFKYLKANEKDRLKEVQQQARAQIEEYSSFEEIQSIPNMNKYTIVAVNDELYVEKI